MVCPRCGNKTDGFKFCPQCGTKTIVRVQKKQLKSVRIPSDPAKANIAFFFAVLAGVCLVYPFFVFICFSVNLSDIHSHSFYMTWLNLITVGMIFSAAFSIAGLTKAIQYEKKYEEYTSRVKAARTISLIVMYFSMVVMYLMAFNLVREYVAKVLN